MPSSPSAVSAPLPRAALGPREALPLEPYALTRHPDAILDRDPDVGTPHFVRRRSGFLSLPAPDATPGQVVSAFLESNARGFTLTPSDLEPPNAVVNQTYTTKHNGVRHVRWQQQKEGLDIYGATFALNLTQDNEIINVSSRALHIPEVRFHDVVKITAEEAMHLAEAHLEGERPREPLPVAIWYPLDMLSVVKAWATPAQVGHENHRLIIRADTGEVVEDIPLTWELEAATFNVYDNDSPAPATPGSDTPTNAPPGMVSRTNVTLVAVNTNASPQGWIPEGENTLLGNNAHVYADWDDDDAPDGPAVTGTTYRVFDYPVDMPSSPASYEATQVQAFYVINQFHDRLWQLGFDEAAGNFQNSNFGRGGSGGDALRVEVQNDFTAREDGLQRISAWYTGSGDGSVGRISVNTATFPPRHDGALDAQVLMHEATHGVSTRLIGDGFGLTKTQSRGLAEGWSDFLALALLSEAGDPLKGTYPFGSYVGERFMQVQHAYFGIRRFPYCTDTNKAPQTLADIDPNQIAFPSDVPMDNHYAAEDADQVHNIGEIWCLALWECRAKLIEHYGFSGNDMMLRLVVDGMKLTPVDPTFAQARDAILQADLLNHGGTNQLALWRGFAKRGLGYSATVPGPSTTVGIQEAFDLPFVVDAQVTEVGGDADGYVEPGENGEIIIVLSSHEMDLTNASASLSVLSSNVTLTASHAVLGTVRAGGATTSSPPFAFTVNPAFPGFTDAVFLLRVESDKGWFEEPILVRIGNPYDYPPEILDVKVANVTEANAWVTWTTGIPADGLVEYGTSTNYGLSTVLDPVMRTNHLAELPGLTKGTEYHCRIVSEGASGLVGISADHIFRTRARIYVNVNSTTAQELGTIEAPFKTLQAAAEAAKTTGDDILVAEGIYTGTNPEAVLNLDGTAYDLTVVGGYSDDFSVCDPNLYVTVIDGERQRRGIRLDNGAALSIRGVAITHGEGEWGGGVHVRAQSSFAGMNCTIEGNASTNGMNERGGGVYATLGASVFVGNCVMKGNVAGLRGGGICAVSTDTSVTLESCHVAGNEAFTGGGIYVQGGASATIISCQLTHNLAENRGGGLDASPFSSVSLERSTIAQNTVSEATIPESHGGGGISVSGSSSTAVLTMKNCVLFDNTAPLYGSDLRAFAQSEAHVNYSCIGDIYGSLTSSNHLIRTDPLFANPAAGDFHLLYGSPCIDTGDPTYDGNAFDIDGEPRPFGGVIDMGADEFTDTDADHMADYWETDTFGDLTSSDGTDHSDADTLDNFHEYLNQTDPFSADTDGDLADDAWEVSNGYDPLNRDMDGDGMWDGWEAIHALNAFSNDAALDPDIDRMNNLAEFTADTDPRDSNSVLRFLSVRQERGGFRLDWQGGRDAWQFLETTDDLLNKTNWMPLYGLPPPTPLTNSIIHFGNSNRNLFYRIRVER